VKAKPLGVTILYDSEEDVWWQEQRQNGEAADDPPVHVFLGEALAARGFKVKKLAATPDIPRLARQLKSDRSDVIFNICDGLDGDFHGAIRVAALLELLGKPFTGSGAEAMAIAQDKVLSKQLFAYYGVPSPRFRLMEMGCRSWEGGLAFPVIVKPTNEDASYGIDDEAVVHAAEELIARVAYVHDSLRKHALIEEYIEGREIYVPILGNDPPQVLPLLEWKLAAVPGRGRIASYGAKWDRSHASYQEVADSFADDLDPETARRIEDMAIKAYRAHRVADYARVDLRLAADGTPYFLEINSNPFLDPTAEVAMAAARTGLDYGALAETIVRLALERYRARIA